mgnify:CR=1 FL=1
MDSRIESLQDLNNKIAAVPDSLDIIAVQRVTKLLVQVGREQPQILGVLAAAIVNKETPNG